MTNSSRASRAEAGAFLWTTGEGGFSVIEVLVATTIITVAVASLAQLSAIAARANAGAKATTFASLVAAQKMEQLRGLAWGFDAAGQPVSDTTTDVAAMPEKPGGRGLQASPPGTLGANVSGYCDFLDATGASLGGGTAPPAGTAYIRRWSIEPLPTNPNNTLVMQVLVARSRNRGAADTTAGTARLPDEARLVSVKTRKAT